MSQLTVNLIFTLDSVLPNTGVDRIQTLVESIDLGENGLNIEQYRAWFDSNFIETSNTNKKAIQESISQGQDEEKAKRVCTRRARPI